MSEALSYIYYFYDKLINFVFAEMEFFNGVTYGWVLIVCFVFGILINNILALPNAVRPLWTKSKSESNGAPMNAYYAIHRQNVRNRRH